jgi:hypothetical protein
MMKLHLLLRTLLQPRLLLVPLLLLVPHDLIENFGGHPKGTTAAASFDVQKSIKCSITESVQMLEELQERIERKGARIRKSALLEIIRQCKEKHNVPPHIDIKRGTIRQRLKRKSSKIGQ